MCLSIPAKVVEVKGNEAIVDLGGNRLRIATDLIDDIQLGQYVLVHAGYAIQVIDENEAQETLDLLNELDFK